LYLLFIAILAYGYTISLQKKKILKLYMENNYQKEKGHEINIKRKN
jgi:hypothetical protein